MSQTRIVLDLHNVRVGTVSPAAEATALPWLAGDWCKNVNPTTAATGLFGWYCSVSGTPGTWVPVYLGVGFAIDDTVVANIAALKALDVTLYATGHKAWVLTKKAPYHIDKTASTVAGDDSFYVAPTTGAGMWVRQMIPVPEWQALATNGTGVFINPTTGNDEGDGTSGAPIKTMAEFNARMWSAEFTTSPRLTVVGAGSTNVKDAIVTGWRCKGAGTVFQLVGTPTVVAAGVAITAAADLDALVGSGFLTSTTTNFSSLGYKSDLTRSLWARRANAVGTATTWAPLYRTHNSGGNFSVDIGPQVELSTALAVAITTDTFSAGDSVDLVSLPVWPNIQTDHGIITVAIRMDLAGGAGATPEIGNVQMRVCGTRGGLTIRAPAILLMQGCQISSTLNIEFGIGANVLHTNFGGEGLVAQLAIAGQLQLSRFTMDSAYMNPQLGGIINCISDGWASNVTTLIVASNLSRVVIPDGVTLGIGANVTNAAALVDGAVFNGTEHLSELVNAFGSGTPYSVGEAGNFVAPPPSIIDGSTGCAIYES